MKTHYVALLMSAVAMLARDSTAEQDAGPQKIVIPPMVEKTSELPKFDAEPFPTEKSKAPKLDEWKDAPLVSLTRSPSGFNGCDVKRVREWMKIHCDRKTAGLRMLAGSSDGVALWVPEPIPTPDGSGSPFETMGRYGEIQFPVRPGDRRLFEFLDLDFGEWDGWGTQSSILVEEQWLEGAKGPEVVLYRR